MRSPGSADCPPAALISVVPVLLVSGWRNEVNFARAAVSEAEVGTEPAVVIGTATLASLWS